MATDLSTEALYPDRSAGVAKSEQSLRYYALDSVRATAMLLGVVYHAILFRMFVGAGGGPGPMGGADSSHWFSEWLHSFRMPLFFLISGFFGRMMLEKYGVWKYLKRRWLRIAVPLFIGLFTFSPLYIVTRDLMAGRGFGPGGGPPPGAMPGPFGPPPPGAPSGGSFERGPGGPMPGMSGRPAAGATEPGSFGPPPGGGPGPGSFGPPPGGGPGPGGFGARENRLSDQLFGQYSHYFDLHHLWFLWYLLVFVTVAPWVAKGFGSLLPRSLEQGADQVSLCLARWGLAPLLFGLIATPTLMMTSSPFGWSLGLAPAIFRGFPDFLLHFDADMAVYFAYFLWGWWLHRQRAALPAVGRAWLPSFLIGLASLAASAALSEAYGRRFDAPNYSLIRAGGSLLYCLGSAWTAWAFLGVFIRYLDRPSRTWRYLADTALWVYLIHQPLVIIGLALFKPLNLPWWAQTAAVSALAAGAALLLYEAVIRPTPLVRLFGPASPGRASAHPEEDLPAAPGSPFPAA